jgi:hypothetical protein
LEIIKATPDGFRVRVPGGPLFTAAELRQRREEIIGHLARGTDRWGGANGGGIFW